MPAQILHFKKPDHVSNHTYLNLYARNSMLLKTDIPKPIKAEIRKLAMQTINRNSERLDW